MFHWKICYQVELSKASVLASDICASHSYWLWFCFTMWREYMQPKYTSERNYSGPLQYRQKKDIINPTSGNAFCIYIAEFAWKVALSFWLEKVCFALVDLYSLLWLFLSISLNISRFAFAGDDMSEGAVVQRKGRFKVTSADLSPRVLFSEVFYFHASDSIMPACLQ